MTAHKKATRIPGEDFLDWCKDEIKRILQVWKKDSEAEANQQFEALKRICMKQKQWRSLMIVYIDFGTHYHYAGNYIKAQEKFEAAYKVAVQYEFKESIAELYYSLSHCYAALELYDEALENLQKGIVLSKELEQYEATVQGVSIIVNLYNRHKSYEKSLETLEENRELLVRGMSSPTIHHLNCLMLYSNNYKVLGKHTQALNYLGQVELLLDGAKRTLREIHYEEIYIATQGEYLDVCMILEDWDHARIYADAIIKWLQQHENMFEKRSFYARIILGKYLYQQKEYRKAANCLEKNLNSKFKLFVHYDTYPYLMKCYAVLKEKEKLLQLIDKQEDFSKQYHDNIRSSEALKYEFLRERHETKIELEHQKKILENVNEMNDGLQRFANIASHDLREPLRTIGSFSQLAKKALQKKQYNRLASYVDFIEQGANSGQKLVSNLYTYAKQGFESLVVEEVDCKKLVELIVLQLDNQISRQGGKVEIGDLPMIKSVRSGLLLVFQNLISNALKFIPPEREPLVRIDCREENNIYYFTITDNGIGIPEEKCAQIFEAFTRLNARHQYDGTGLGLATCKRVVDNMGGEISVQSEVGEGTTFIVALAEMV